MARLADNSAIHISNPELYEPAVSNAFQFVINPALAKLLYAGVDSTVEDVMKDESNYLSNIDETIRLSLITGKVPHFSLDPIEIRRGNSKIKYAGMPTFDNEDLTLHDFVGARTKDALLAWQALAYDVVNDVVKSASNYKFDCTLLEYTPDMSRVLRSWTLKGCWISGLSEDPFNISERNERTITATLHYDRAIPDHTGYAA